MPGTKVTMVRKTIFRSGAYTYEILATCTDKGSLADKNIFVFEISDLTDPKDDSFYRVAEPGDFDYQVSRDAALAKNELFWRQDRATFNYDNIETANAAWQELSARINALVETNDIYITTFETTDVGTVYTYPMVADSIRDQLVNAFRDKEDELEIATTERDAKIDSCSGHETDIAAIQTQINAANADLTTYLSVQASVSAVRAIYVTIQAALVAGNTQIRNLNNTSDATDAQQNLIDAQLSQDQANLALFATQNTALGTALTGGVASAVATVQARIAALQQAKNNLYTELNLCTQETTRLGAVVTAAQSARDGALQAVLAVCPDFEP
jgi:hypothetical protein